MDYPKGHYENSFAIKDLSVSELNTSSQQLVVQLSN